ncbi:MAG TPA: hypothetical protein VGV35_07025 [Bryobacteraceae bacterium]|nr:hypothetical protein [Bryobacteraceae bacterium]
MEGNGNTPATRADLDRLEKRIVERLHDTVTHAELEQLEKRIGERLHDMETKLLGAFFQYQEHADVRMRKMSADISNMDTASDLRLERRVIEIERKILGGST